MKTYYHKKYLFLFLFFVPSLLYGQEVLIELTSNGIVKEYYQDHYQETRVKSSLFLTDLELPFFDDFSHSRIYPDPLLWEDKFAFINSTYSVDPVSIGVATLDAIDHT